MASDLRLRVGNASATITLNGPDGQFTDAQVAQVLERFAISLGIPVEGTANERLTSLLEHIRDDVRRRSREAQYRMLMADAEANIVAVVDSDNKL